MPTDAKSHHLAEIEKHTASARRILDGAEREGRELSADEQHEAGAHVRQIETHRGAVEAFEDADARRGLLATLGRPDTTDMSPGAMLTSSSKYIEWREAARRGDSARIDTSIETPNFMAAVGDTVRESTSSTAIVPQWQPFLTAPGLVPYPTVIQQVLNIQQLDEGNTAVWPKVTTRAITDLTDTAETENKAGTDFVFGQATAVLLKWTAFAAVSDELFQDSQAIVRYVNNELGVMTLQKEEKAILQALYTASTTASTGYTIQSSPNGFDKLLEGMTMIRVAGGNPDFVAINPYDWASFMASRWTNGGYFSGGPFSAPPEAPVWGGVRFVQTPQVPKGTPLVGDSRGAILFRQGGLRVESSNSHGEFDRQRCEGSRVGAQDAHDRLQVRVRL